MIASTLVAFRQLQLMLMVLRMGLLLPYIPPAAEHPKLQRPAHAHVNQSAGQAKTTEAQIR